MIVLNKHSIDASITERYANISYIFEFENVNDYGSNELAFEITIHPDAFISGFIADIDGELFSGETKEKKEAKKEYTSAKQKNENAILISQPYPDIPNVFKIQTNIDSKSKILLTIKIEQYLKKQFNFNELNIEIINATDFKSNIKPNYENILFEIKIRDKRGIFDIKLPSNNDIVIDTNIMNKNKTLCTINGKIISRINEFILKYKINGEQNESNTLYDPKSKTFVHIINNITSNAIININENNNILEGKNDDNKTENIIPRRVVFIVDKSASMRGTKWNKTILATIKTLKQLRNNYDRYCIVFFDENIQLSSNIGMILADKTNILQTISYVRNQRIGGATNIEIALLKGIELIKNDIKLFTDSDFKDNNFFENQIIFMTDGEPNRGEINTNNIISNVINKNKLNDKYSEKISIFSFGVGSDKNDSSWTKDLNHSFLKLLSLNNNGIYKRIKQSQCDTQLNEYFNILSKPILCNINIKYQDSNCNNLTKTFFNTLYSGNDIIICGQLQNDKILNLTANISAITGIKQNNNSKFCVKPVEINKEIKINLMDSISTISIDEKENINDINNNNNNIERIWAFLKLKQFAEKRLLNNDMIEYDDNDNKLPLLLAMKYSFVTPWTSMIVVKHKSVKTEHQLDDAENNANVQVSKNILSDRRKPPISHSAAPNRFAVNVNVLHYSDDDDDDDDDMYACMNMYDYDDDDDYGGLDDDDDDIITLKSGGTNPISFEIPKRSAENAKFVTTILEGDADATSIEIRQVQPEILKIVIEYLNSCDKTIWNAKQWINTFNIGIMVKIRDAANYMDIKQLYLLAKDATDKKEKEMNSLIDIKLTTISQPMGSNESIKLIDEMLLTFKPQKMVLSAVSDNMKWSAQQVSEWIGSIGNEYKQYVQEFVDNDIDGEFMNEIGDDELKEMEINLELHRKTIMSAWSKLCDMGLIHCTVTNMIYLIERILKRNVFGVDDNGKEIICGYFKENKINARLFISLVEKGGFVKDLMNYIQQMKGNKKEISNKSLIMLQRGILEVVM